MCSFIYKFQAVLWLIFQILLLKKKTLLVVNVNREERISAAFVIYGDYSEYIWLADADTTELQLDNFPYILSYLQYTTSSLELSFMSNVMNVAEIVSWQRDGGYKELFHRVVQHSCKGYKCLNNLRVFCLYN